MRLNVIIVLCTLFSVTNSCTKIVQACHKCKGHSSVCSNGFGFIASSESCASHVMSSSTSVAAHYFPFLIWCKPFTCTNNLYFSDSYVFAFRETCNTDCPIFTLTEHVDSEIQTPEFSSGSKSLGQCFEDCFDTPGCYTFSYDGSECNIYTSCGTSCKMKSSPGTTVYTRVCSGDNQAADCGSLTDPPNGVVDTSSGTLTNSQAIYTCSLGYTLVGSNTRTCQTDGQWDGSEPVCNPVACEALTSPTNGVVNVSSGTTFSSQAVYTCDTGYTVVGNSLRICQSDGQWSGSEPSCSIVDCGSLSAPDNGYVQNPVIPTYLEEAKFSCLRGYDLVGSNKSTCQSNSIWSHSVPVCNPVDCGTPTAPMNGGVVVANGTTYGQDAVFSCNAGYSLFGVAVSTCNANGFWGASPLCSLSGDPVPIPIKLFITPCICYSNKTFANMTQEEIIKYLIKETRIERNSTSLARRKRECADDPRMSSQLVGYSGIIVIAVALGVVLLSDILMFCKWCDKKRYDEY